MRFLIKTDPELLLVSKFSLKYVELRCNVSSCDQAVKIEITSKNLKKWPKNGTFWPIFEVFFILTAWLQYLTLKHIVQKICKILRPFKGLHLS